MSELDDLEELAIDLTATRSGSARRIRAGIKSVQRNIFAKGHAKPLWKRQLNAERIADARKDNDR